MHLRGLAIGALFLTLALAGCSDDKEGEGSDTTTDTGAPITYSNTPTSSSSSSSSTSASSTSTSSSPANRAPTGAISVVVNGTTATFDLTGTDPDGDALVWGLEFGDGNSTNGTTLPTTLSHNYTAGNFTANFTITDGSAMATYNVSLNVTGGASGGGGAEISGTVAVACALCFDAADNGAPMVGSVSLASGEQGFDAIWLALTPEMAGLPYSMSAAAGDADALLLSACAPDASVVAISDAEGPEGGAVPAGVGCILAYQFFIDVPNDTLTIKVG